MATKEPFDPSRNALAGYSGPDPEDLAAAATDPGGPLRLFKKGVVIEVLGDPTTRDDDFFKKNILTEDDDDEEERELNVTNDEELSDAPRNSLIVKCVDGGQGRDNNDTVICYPFFSSHISLPVKPGETVWYMYITPEAPGTIAYWLTRVCDKEYVEDANFTHHDRRHDEVEPPEEGARLVPSLHNGADTSEEDPDETAKTLLDPNAFISLRSESLETGRFVIEPVPRIAKRPGDLVLQGSNNTAIVLGTDRGYGLIERPSGTPLVKPGDSDSLGRLKGSIDLVAGRGRIYGEESFKDLADQEPKGTRPRVVKNLEEDFEVDKNIANHPDKGDAKKGARVNLTVDPNEGDSDFVNDASRIYISMQTDVDVNFGTTLENIPEAYDASAEESTLQPAAGVAAIALKSDEIRIIARKTKDQVTTIKDTEYEDVADINGSIRIIKEGDPKTDAACIYLLPDGTIQITGSKIMIGRGTTRDEGTALDPAKDEKDKDVGFAEPYMRYTEFTEWAEGLIDAINAAFANAQKAINANGGSMSKCGNAGQTGGAGGAMPAPNAPLGAAIAQLLQNSETFDSSPDQQAISDFKDTTPIKSTRIFGE